MLYRVLFATLTIYLVNGITIPCSGSTCTLECDTTDACNDNDYTCPSGKDCVVICSGQPSCKGNFELDASAATSLTVTCTEKDACVGGEFTCPDSGTCDFTCSAEKACEDADVEGDFTCTDYAGGVCPAGGSSPSTTSSTSTTGSTETSTTATSTTGSTETSTTGSTETSTTSTNGESSTTSSTETGEEEEEEEEEESSDSSSDDNAFAEAENSIMDELNGGDDNGQGHIVLSLSDNALANLWGLVAAFILVNCTLFYCFCYKKKNNKATFEQSAV